LIGTGSPALDADVPTILKLLMVVVKTTGVELLPPPPHAVNTRKEDNSSIPNLKEIFINHP
jgi:hypothetical protein